MSKYNHTKIPPNGEPVECHVCTSKSIGYETVDKIDHIVCEKIAFCEDCNEYLGYWAYGRWEWDPP